MAPLAQSQEGVIIPRGYVETGAQKIAMTAMLALSFSRFSPFIFDVETRDRLPEPLDIVDHIGNASVSYVLADIMSHSFWQHNWKLATPEEMESRRKTIGIIVGLGVVAANVYAEKVGWSTFNTYDPIDFVYGCLGGYLGYKLARPRYVAPETVNRIEENSPDSPFARSVKWLREREALTYRRVSSPKHTETRQPSKDKSSGSHRRKAARKQQRQSRKRNR